MTVKELKQALNQMPNNSETNVESVDSNESKVVLGLSKYSASKPASKKKGDKEDAEHKSL